MNRRNIVNLSAILALAIIVLPGSADAQRKALKDQLVGTWTLVSVAQTTKEGVKSDRWGPNPKGRVVFDANGRYSFMIFRSDVPKFAINNLNQGTPEENKAALQGMTANYGTWKVDEATKTITTNIEGASFPNLVGGTQTRVVSSLNEDELRYINSASLIGTVDEAVWKRE